MIKVLIADNHPIVRLGIRQVLETSSDIEVIADVSTTEELFKTLKDVNPDVVILEMDIPEINGIATLRKMKLEFPDIKTLMYSGQSEDVYALSTIRAGAFGYLSKTADLEYIISAVKKVKEKTQDSQGDHTEILEEIMNYLQLNKLLNAKLNRVLS